MKESWSPDPVLLATVFVVSGRTLALLGHQPCDL